MALALALTLVASGACALTAPRGWRHRVHHLLPAPAMALGMGHAGLPAGLLTAVLAAGALWACAVHLGRRAWRGQAVLGADAVDCAAMAVALVVAALHGAGQRVPSYGVQAAVSATSHHEAHALPHLSGTTQPGWWLLVAVLLGLGVLVSRVLLAGGKASSDLPVGGGCRSRTAVTTGTGLLMATATVLMLVA